MANDTFWRKHCNAVPLVKAQENGGIVAVNHLGKPVRTHDVLYEGQNNQNQSQNPKKTRTCHLTHLTPLAAGHRCIPKVFSEEKNRPHSSQSHSHILPCCATS